MLARGECTLTFAVGDGQLVRVDVVEVLADPVVDEPSEKRFQHGLSRCSPLALRLTHLTRSLQVSQEQVTRGGRGRSSRETRAASSSE